MVQTMTKAALLALPVMVDIPTAGRAFGIGRSAAYELANCEGFPVEVVRVGRQIRVRRSDLLRAVGVDDDASAVDVEDATR